MRVYVEHDMTVNHNTNVVTLKAGEIVEGPLAVYLVESNCDVTVEDVPAAVNLEQPPAEPGVPAGEESHTPGSGEATAEPGAAE